MKNKNLFQYICILAIILSLAGVMGTAAFRLERTQPEQKVKETTASIPVEAVSATATSTEEEMEAETVPVYQKEPIEASEDNQDSQDPSEEQQQDTQQEDEDSSDTNDEMEENPNANQNANGTGTAPGNQNNPTTQNNGPGGTQGTNPQNPTAGNTTNTDFSLLTDLANQTITYSQLTNDQYKFYAYLANEQVGMSLKVKVVNSKTPKNGTYLTADGRNYQTALVKGETNDFTIYVKKGEQTVKEYTYHVKYTADMANKDNPTVGDAPPTVATNLDSFSGEMTNQNFTFTVKARTHDNKVLSASNVKVAFDGSVVKNPTGSKTLEYQLYIPKPKSGDTQKHTVAVLAWDDEGNSVYKKYKFTYRLTEDGDEIGTAYIAIDATVVGLGMLEDPYEYKLKQGEPASYAVQKMLEDSGYSVSHGGTLDNGYYVKRISRGGMTDGASVPDKLWQKVKDDGLTLTNQKYSDSLGEFDYTQGSGWMYSVGGSLYAGKGLSSYFLSDGDTLYLRFTLAYGKDIGGSAGGQGSLSTYCGTWVNGKFKDEHKWKSETIQEATCTKDGESGKVCTVCGDKSDVTKTDALGHNFKETDRKEATTEREGKITYTCKRCGATKEESIPKKEKPKDETTEPEADPGKEQSDNGDDGNNEE